MEGLELAKELISRKPTDLITLGNLDKVFVAANDYKSSVRMFEEAFRTVPTEDIGSLLFFSVMRSQETKQLFTMALKLHSMFKGERYLFWAINALYLQSRTPGLPSEESARSLKLAEKMLLKAFSPDKVERRSYEEILLLLQTLQATGNQSAALAIFETCDKRKFANADERLLLHIELLVRNKAFEQALAQLEEVMRARGILDWTLWKLYVNAIDACPDKPARVAALPAFFDGVKQATDERTWQLARIDASIVFNAGSGEIVANVLQYLYSHVDKEVCIPDMQHTIKALDSTAISMLCSKMCEHPDELKWARLQRLFQMALPEKPGVSPAAPTDLMVHRPKEWLLHAAICFVDQYGSSRSISDLLLAQKSCLTFMQSNPDDFAAKLLGILLSIHLGHGASALSFFRSLEIKQLQLDTLAYVITDHAIELGMPAADAFLQESFLIYDENRTVSWSLLAEAFSRSSHHNIGEFYEFARRLEYSMQAVACICGSIRYELLHRDFTAISEYLVGLRPEELLFDDAFVSNLSDNRDRDVFDFCDHAGAVRAILLDGLPNFGLAAIPIFTFLPIILRSLIISDHDQLKILIERHLKFSVSMQDKPVDSYERKRLDFIAALVSAVESYAQSSFDPNCLASSLAELPNRSDRPDTLALIMTSPYTLLSEWHSLVEQDRWLCLTIASLIKGQASAKSRRLVRSTMMSLICNLESLCRERVRGLAHSKELLRDLPCPVAEGEVNWDDLKSTWGQCLSSLESIAADSTSILKLEF